MELTPAEKERFLSRLDQTGDCWLWTGALTDGYGNVVIGQRNYRAHRVAYELFVGPVPDKLYVLHRCDVRNCCRPDHLFVGTPFENVMDCNAKSRRGAGLQCVLTEDQVREIRRLWATGSYTQAQLGERFGTRNTNIQRIVTGQTWKYVS